MSNRYINIPKKKINGKQIYQTVKYPEIPLDIDDIYVYSTHGDRFDILAQQYYGNQSYWWIISIANPSLSQNSILLPEGEQIRIPFNPSRIISTFNTLNGFI